MSAANRNNYVTKEFTWVSKPCSCEASYTVAVLDSLYRGLMTLTRPLYIKLHFSVYIFKNNMHICIAIW